MRQGSQFLAPSAELQPAGQNADVGAVLAVGRSDGAGVSVGAALCVGKLVGKRLWVGVSVGSMILTYTKCVVVCDLPA